MADGYTTLRVDRTGAVAEVVLANPGRLNAMGPTFFGEIRRVFESLDREAPETLDVAALCTVVCSPVPVAERSP